MPKDDRNWARNLSGDFARLGDGEQRVIIKLIVDIQKLSPERAIKVGRWLSDYFDGVTRENTPAQVIEHLQEELLATSKPTIH